MTILGVSVPEDKQILIDENESEVTETAGQDETLNHSRPPITLEEGSLDFETEYQQLHPKPTFQPCSSPQHVDKLGWRKWLYCKIRRLTSPFHGMIQTLRFHWKFLVSSLLLVIGSSGCLISFPMHLESVSRGSIEVGDGYTACLAVSTITTLMFLFVCVGLEVIERRKRFSSDSVLSPTLGWQNILKVGFCLGMSIATIFYAWEDDKVPCNFQDPLLGLVIIFAIITHAVVKWKTVGLKRTFALSAVAAGVFLSVDYPLVDHHRCRGYYYKDNEEHTLGWTWKVHLVWTMAFIVSIWLTVVAAFFLESAIPIPKVKHNRLYDLEYNAVKLRVMSPQPNRDEDGLPQDMSFSKHWPNYHFSPYSSLQFGLIANSVLWFSVATWTVIISLFWTEFIPGFGKGIASDKIPTRILSAFHTSLTSWSSWAFCISIVVFSHSFTYLTVLTRSPITGISVSTIGFPIIGLWWSFFQMHYSVFVWMPVFSGELVCSGLGLITVIVGVYYFVKFEILRPAQIINYNKRHEAFSQHY